MAKRACKIPAVMSVLLSSIIACSIFVKKIKDLDSWDTQVTSDREVTLHNLLQVSCSHRLLNQSLQKLQETACIQSETMDCCLNLLHMLLEDKTPRCHGNLGFVDLKVGVQSLSCLCNFGRKSSPFSKSLWLEDFLF